MKRILILFLLLISVFVFAQKEIKVDSKVIGATVFKNRALVTRQAELFLTAGKHKLVF